MRGLSEVACGAYGLHGAAANGSIMQVLPFMVYSLLDNNVDMVMDASDCRE